MDEEQLIEFFENHPALGCGCCSSYDYEKYTGREEALAADLIKEMTVRSVEPAGEAAEQIQEWYDRLDDPH